MKNDGKNLLSPKFVIITGLSGSGMSSATNAFEDLDYFCVDNLPLTMLPTFARLLVPDEEGKAAIEKAALVINIRERHFLSEFPNAVVKLRKKERAPFVLFLEASENVLRRRFSETRRPHPADNGEGLLESIRAEREALSGIRQMADMIIDTSELTVHTLRRSIIEKFGIADESVPMRVQITSFGHKFGNPIDADLMFDVRHLPNPYFDRTIRSLTGEDPKIIKYLEKYDEVEETIRRFVDLLLYLLPLYRREGKAYLTVGIGCTGGRHRSVVVANKLGEILRNENYDVTVSHRDIAK
jgi:UPF0042 nucleotide-binding protein